MFNFKQIFLLNLLLICLACILAQESSQPPVLSLLVPRLKQEHVQVIPNGQRYNLRITLPDGSLVDENVELLNPGTAEQELFTMGTIRINYPDTNGVSVILYEAGKNGYVVKYKYEKLIALSLSPNVLKSSTG